jgi:glycosyltransferase 2 family protein
LSRRSSVALKALLTLAILGFVLYSVDLRTVLPALKRLDLAVAPWVLLLAGVQTLMLAARWAVISGVVGGHLSFGSAFRGILISYFFSQGLPASVGGDVFRVWWLRRETGLNTGEASHAVLIDRLAGFFSLLLLSAVSIALLAWTTRGEGVTAMELIVGGGMVCAIVLVLPISHRLRHVWRTLSSRAPPRLRRALIWAAEFKLLLTRVGSRIGVTVLGLTIGVAVHLLAVCMAFLVVRALGYDLAFWQCLAVVPPALLLTYLPISIAGWGTREATMIFGFSLFGLPATGGFLVSIVIGTIILIVSLFGGALWIGSELRVSFNRLYHRPDGP